MMHFGQILRCEAPCQVALFDPDIGNGAFQRLSFSPIYALARRVLADGVLGDGRNLVIRERIYGAYNFARIRFGFAPSLTSCNSPLPSYAIS